MPQAAGGAWGHVAVFPCQLSVLHHMAPRFGIPIWVPAIIVSAQAECLGVGPPCCVSLAYQDHGIPREAGGLGCGEAVDATVSHTFSNIAVLSWSLRASRRAAELRGILPCLKDIAPGLHVSVWVSAVIVIPKAQLDGIWPPCTVGLLGQDTAIPVDAFSPIFCCAPRASVGDALALEAGCSGIYITAFPNKSVRALADEVREIQGLLTRTPIEASRFTATSDGHRVALCLAAVAPAVFHPIASEHGT